MSGFCYEEMVQDALLSVVKRALKDVARNGLSGDHHFYISFKTFFPGVEIPEYLRERHPDEMMVVIQYQFEKLEVREHDFSVMLSFSGKYEHLTIPYNALVAFVDPSVRFGLQFTPRIDGTPQDDESLKLGDSNDCKIINFESFKKK